MQHLSDEYLKNPFNENELLAQQASVKTKKQDLENSLVEAIMHPFGKGNKAPPVVEDDARLRERVPPRKAATSWEGISPEKKERILASRKRWRDIRLAEEERDLTLEH